MSEFEGKKAAADPWMTAMRSGDFEEAWKFSDGVLKSGLNRDYNHLPRHQQCIWDGTPLNGKRVLVRCYHGLGDTIQFIRYAARLKEIASQVIVWAQPPLIELLKSVAGIDVLLPLHNGVPDVEYDVDVEVMELPFIFRTTVDTIPSDLPYLHAEPLVLSSHSDKLTVGLVWQPGDWDQASRCIPFADLQPLADVKGIELHILQFEPESAGWKKGFGTYEGPFNLYDYARVIKGLDLLITADSMPAHLAGALNVPVWTLLHAQADWRWMDNREESPWYPSMKLFKQEQPGNWKPVLQKVVDQLKSLAGSV